MSWSISLIGKSPDVKFAALTDKYLPQPLKDTVALFADANRDQAIELKTSGHYDASYPTGSNVYTFSINPVMLAPPAPPTIEEQMAGSPAAPMPPGGWPQAEPPKN